MRCFWFWFAWYFVVNWVVIFGYGWSVEICRCTWVFFFGFNELGLYSRIVLRMVGSVFIFMLVFIMVLLRNWVMLMVMLKFLLMIMVLGWSWWLLMSKWG